MIVEPPRPMIGRAGQPVNLTCTATGSPTPTITWFRDRVMIPGAIFQFLYIPSAKPEDRGSYFCVATNSEGSMESSQALVNLEGMASSAIVSSYTVSLTDSFLLCKDLFPYP